MSTQPSLPPDFSSDWSQQFPVLRQSIFFNHAGVAPLSQPAADAITQYALHASQHAYVKSGWYARAHQVKRLAARLLDAQGPEEIAFVPNTSTGLSLVARGLDWQEGDNVVITNVEYPANRYPWEDLAKLGVQMIQVPQQLDGRIDVHDVCEAITDRTRVVSLSHVQYASGYRIPLRPIADMVHRAGGYLCVDAIQSLGALPVSVRDSGIDFLSADGHKWLLGPEGAGLFYARADLIPLLHPNVVGWMNMVNASDYGNYQFEFQMDARRFEPGSYNIPGILALGASLQLLLDIGMDRVWSRIQALTDRLCQGLQARGYRVFSPRKPEEKSGIVVFEPPQASDASAIPPATGGTSKPESGSHGACHRSPAQIVAELEQKGIIIVIREGRLRASPHFYNTPAQIDALINALP